MNWLLIIVIAIIAGYMVYGYSKGFLKTLYSMLAWVVILALVTFATPYICEFIKDHTSIEQNLEDKSKDVITNMVESISEDSDENESEKRVEHMNQILQDNVGVRIPKAITVILVGQENLAGNLLESAGVYDKMSEKIASMALMGMSFVICLLIIVLITKVLSKALEKVNDVPVVGTMNKFLGLLLGAVKGLTVVWICFAIVAFNAASDLGVKITSYIYTSEVLVWLYEKNVFVNVFMKIWN